MVMTPREAGIQAFYADESTSNTLQGLNAAFDAYEAAGWQPIETAPKDTDVITWTPAENYRPGIICGMHVGYFRTDLMVWHISDDEWELAPSLWQPPPSPPPAKAKEA